MPLDWSKLFTPWMWGTKARASTQPLDFAGFSARFFGPGVSGNVSQDILLQEAKGLVGISARAIANRLSSLNPQVVVTRRVQEGTEEEEILDDHPLADLLAQPHPNLSWRQLMRLSGQYLTLVGEFYLLKVGNGIRVAELHPMPPSRVTPLIRGGVISGYAVTQKDGQQVVLPEDVVIRAYLPDPENFWRAQGYFSTSAVEADAHQFANEHLRHHYQHDATPKTALEAQENADDFDEETREIMRAEFEQLYHGRHGQHSGTPFVIPTGYKLIQMMMNSGSDITPLLEYWRDDLLLNFGVPRSVLGQVVSGDRSSAETNQFVFDLHTVLPLAQIIEEVLTSQLAMEFDPKLMVRFAPFVSEDKEFTLKQEAQDLSHAVRTPNQVLTDRQSDPVDWGDQPLIASKLRPYDPNEKDSPKPNEKEEEETETEEDEEDSRALRQQIHQLVRKLEKKTKTAA